MSQPPPPPPPPPGGPPPGAGWGQPGPAYQPAPGQPGYPPQGRGGSNNLLLIVGGLVVLAVVGLGAVLLLSGDDDGDSDDSSNGDSELRDDYVDAFVVRGQTENEDGLYSDDEIECISAAGVDAWGVDTLEEAVSPDELRADPEAETEEFGLERDTEWGTDVWDSIQGCADFADILRRSLEIGVPGQQELVSCVMDGLSEDEIEEVAVALFTDDEATYRAVLGARETACT